MSFPKYPEYKDSGVEWLGEVPAHWGVVKLGYLAISQGGGTPPKDELRYWNGSIPWVTPKDMKQQWITSTIDTLAEAALHASPVSMIEPGHVLVVFRSGILRHRIPVAINKVPVTVNQDIRAYNVRPRLLPDFFLRLTQGLNRELLPEWSKQGATVESLDSELVSSTQLPVPPREEQEAITAFLDHETARIDALVEEQQRLIELLKEKRQAVISHAVTKGLDSDVPMKDSGVEWLGEVPAHWDVRKASYIGRLFGSDNVPEDMVYDEGDTPYLKVGSLSADSLEVADWGWYVDSSISGTYRACDHYVVFPKRGAAIFLNKVNVVSRPALIDPNLMGWEIEGHHSTWYFAYSLKLRKLDELADVSTVPQINNKHIGPERFPVPPIEEQEEIASYLQKRLGSIDELVATSESGVKLLQERRSALISAVVTGKIDVRGWQPPAGSSALTDTTQTEMV